MKIWNLYSMPGIVARFNCSCLKCKFHDTVDCRSASGRRRHRLCRFKRKESNYISATCHVIVTVLVCIALAESRWFYVQGGRCSDARHSSVHYLGVRTFFYQGSSSTAFGNRNAYFYGNSVHDGKCLCCLFSVTVTDTKSSSTV